MYINEMDEQGHDQKIENDSYCDPLLHLTTI